MRQANTRVGHYTLLRLLETHGLDEVWLAEPFERTSSIQVALNVHSLENRRLDQAMEEASIWAQASGHPNILSFIESEVYDDLFLIASEYAPEGSLSQLLSARRGKSLPYNLTAGIVTGILVGLEHLHAQKIIHRDLKPAYVYLRGDTPCLAGFGLACRSEHNKASDQIVGTPAYMAPEAWLGKHSKQTDLWSVTVILYELLTGQLPFRGDASITSLAAAVLRSDPAPLPAKIPLRLREVLSLGLKKDPTHRYNTAIEMRLALQYAMKASA